MTEPVADREELLALLWKAARGGSVTAMRILFQELRRQEKDPGGPTGSSFMDELARKRPRGRS